MHIVEKGKRYVNRRPEDKASRNGNTSADGERPKSKHTLWYWARLTKQIMRTINDLKARIELDFFFSISNEKREEKTDEISDTIRNFSALAFNYGILPTYLFNFQYIRAREGEGGRENSSDGNFVFFFWRAIGIRYYKCVGWLSMTRVHCYYEATGALFWMNFQRSTHAHRIRYTHMRVLK